VYFLTCVQLYGRCTVEELPTCDLPALTRIDLVSTLGGLGKWEAYTSSSLLRFNCASTGEAGLLHGHVPGLSEGGAMGEGGEG
jgi:hypothetical protein